MSDGDGGNHLGFAGGQKAFIERLQDGIVTLGYLGAEEQSGTDRWPTAANVGLPLPSARLADEGSEASRIVFSCGSRNESAFSGEGRKLLTNASAGDPLLERVGG